MSSIYINPSASSVSIRSSHTNRSQIRKFHSQLPSFNTTPLVRLAELGGELGLKALFVKDESSRCGLPSFKILGASWAIHKSICAAAHLPLETHVEQVAAFAQQHQLCLYTATDGNHGRAVAHMSSILGIPAHVYVPHFTDAETREHIRAESPDDVCVHGVGGDDYDAAVHRAYHASLASERNLFIQDTSVERYEDVPRWCVEAYSTMLREIRDVGVRPTHIVTPVGVGSLANAVVTFAKSRGRGIRVIAVEPESAACLNASLKAGVTTVVETGSTIMDGMNCGSLSAISWMTLRKGIDASLTISDMECHNAVQDIQEHGVHAGPCGAATYAGFKKLMGDQDAVNALGIGQDSVVVLLSTEGVRHYKVPE